MALSFYACTGKFLNVHECVPACVRASVLGMESGPLEEKAVLLTAGPPF